MLSTRLALAPMALVVTLVAALAACSPTRTPGITHATGASDLVFRISVGGGFAGLAMRPQVSLYGDGSLVYLDPAAPLPTPVGRVQPQRPYRIARISEGHVQTLLGAAVAALGSARESYRAAGADYFTYLLRLTAGGIDREVSVFGLEGGAPEASDAAAWAAFRSLLNAVSVELAGISGSAVYAPTTFGAMLSTILGPADARGWPWPGLTLADFSPTQGNVAFVGRLTAAQVAALGLAEADGGLAGLVLRAPDGRLYDVRITPLLPDEAS